VALVLAAAACGNENKLGNGVDNGFGDDDDDDDDDDTTPTVTTDDTGWIWTTTDTEDTDTIGTGTGTTGTGTGTGTGGGDTGTGTGTGTGGTTTTTPPTGDEVCDLAAATGLATALDPYQIPGDGRVVYCHSSAGNSYNYVESDISSCLPHINHNFDIFPSTGCDS
jgi:hypothetical protein